MTDLPLYPTEEELAKVVLSPKRSKAWSGIAVTLERHGLPKVDPLFGGRYWPAVKAWLDRHNGLGKDDVPQVPDGSDDYGHLFDNGSSRSGVAPASRR